MNIIIKLCRGYILLFYITSVYVITDIMAETRSPQCSNIQRHEIESHLSTKTPYRVVANKNDTAPKYPGCRPTRIWSVIRHGARNPSKDVIKLARVKLMTLKWKILSNAKTRLCREELERLKHWNFNISTKEEKFLVAEGEDELIELAERMQNRFPEIFPDLYHPTSYYFKFTATQRTRESAKSYATGLFGRHHIKGIQYPKPLHKDPILRFYKLCTRWIISVDKNASALMNADEFVRGPIMHDAIDHMKRLTQIDDITADEARLIYTICAFETAWNRHREPSVWCHLLTNHTITAMEFAEDLEYYWNDGYGYNITYTIACPIIANMFEFLDPMSDKPNATIYFTHSGTILKLLAHLGLYRDTIHLTSGDYRKPRLWRTSIIDAFATNLAFVLYECEQHKKAVLSLHQERVIHIPGCPPDSDLCSFNLFKGIFENSLHNCAFNEICQL